VWNTPGQYSVVLTVTKYSCPTKDTMMVDVLPVPVAGYTFDNQCSGFPTQFTDTSQGNINQWYWNFGDSSPSDSIASPIHTYQNGGSYWIEFIVNEVNGCTDTLEQEFIVYQTPTSPFLTESPLCTGINSIVTYVGNATPDAIYTWNFGGGMVVNGTGQGPYEISWPGANTYAISLVVSNNGCYSDTTTDSVEIQVCLIEIPNIFTPNVDGSNDVFQIKGLESFPDSKLQIFNRWGKLIYKNDDYKNDWDGKDHADGVYYYVLILKNGDQYHGTVTLLR
jgi:gliding motility-associated-like protein